MPHVTQRRGGAAAWSARLRAERLLDRLTAGAGRHQAGDPGHACHLLEEPPTTESLTLHARLPSDHHGLLCESVPSPSIVAERRGVFPTPRPGCHQVRRGGFWTYLTP